MGKKLLINVLYNLVIFVSIITGYQYGINNYGYLVGAVIIIAIFIVLKIRLLKQIKAAQKP
ncbi:MAG: DUF6358 family protein [Sphingobacteriales bacterium]